MISRQVIILLVLSFGILFVDGDASGDLQDLSLECQHGYRLSALRRSPPVRGRLGALTVECDLVATDVSQVTCDRLRTIPGCDGTSEGCSDDSWLAGFHVYTLENKTGAVILDPVCCSAPNVAIDGKSCITDRLNKPRNQFDHALADNVVYRGMKCHHYFNNEQLLDDIVWKLEICPAQSVAQRERANFIKTS
ncbi:hypothetical protein AB6A40_004006 [Gnathostoma spinigerum]|uniref:Uncharacterized protein n=1 Tax=Gnathostoma spinigerum TaxID=75299 RepID=A0ABD6EKR7_9BILA